MNSMLILISVVSAVVIFCFLPEALRILRETRKKKQEKSF